MKPRARLQRPFAPARFVVRCLDVEPDKQLAGAAVLTPHCHAQEAERILSTIGVYAPRGLDRLHWSEDGNSAVIKGADGEPMVRLTRDDVTREQRLANIVEQYPAHENEHGVRDDEELRPPRRFALVRYDGTDYEVTTHRAMDEAIEYFEDDGAGFDPWLLVDLDTGAEYDPVITHSWQPRAAAEEHVS